MTGADETPAWVDGGWKYVHVACTDMLTLLHAGSRSKDDTLLIAKKWMRGPPRPVTAACG